MPEGAAVSGVVIVLSGLGSATPAVVAPSKDPGVARTMLVSETRETAPEPRRVSRLSRIEPNAKPATHTRNSLQSWGESGAATGGDAV